MESTLDTRSDIQDRSDIERLVNTFYEKVKHDALIAHFFTDVVDVDWAAHLPVMYDFWENILSYTGKYHGNPMATHLQLNAKHPISAQDFQRWLALFHGTVDELFAGEKADLIKARSLSIATVLQIKMAQAQARET